MSVVQVAVPLLRGKRRFHIDKGRPWSIVEHTILAALAEKPYRAIDLAEEANLPRRLVIELVVRLMRAGWVELTQKTDGVLFSASERGKAAAKQDELPIVPKRMNRWIGFVIDQITGTIYRTREMPPFERHVLIERAKTEPIIWIDQPRQDVEPNLKDIVGSLFHEDEHFVGLDQVGDRFVHRFALVTVKDGQIDGLAKRAPQQFREIVLKAALQTDPELGAMVTAFKASPPPALSETKINEPIDVTFAHDDLVLGGQAHKEIFEDTIQRAKHRMIIHSTFVSQSSLEDWLPKLYNAAQRGVKIDILWGESDEKKEVNKTRATVLDLRKKIEIDGLTQSIRVHTFTTGSHAKFIIADKGRSDRFIGILGSCNWLSSGFHSFEASARLRDPAILGLLTFQLVELSRGASGHWTALSSDFYRLAETISKMPRPTGPKAKASIVLGSAHKHYVRDARDNSKSEIFVTSHRFGVGGRQSVIVPALAAAEARSIKTNVFYGIASGKGAANLVAANTIGNADSGVQIKAVHNPRLHAKILGWDDDNLVLTSQNWLSADPGDVDPLQEIGIFVKSTGIARMVRERFNSVKVD